MAIGDAYCTAAEYRAHADKDTQEDDVELGADLLAVSRLIDRLTGYTETGFNKDDTAVTRVYVPDEYSPLSAVLDVDAIAVAPTSIKIDTDYDGDFTDETALAAADYELHPLNAARGPVARPWTQIVLTEWGAYGYWPQRARVQVTAQFGWPAVPESVKRATAHVTQLLRLEGPRATNTLTEIDRIEQVTSPAQKVLRDLITQWRHPRSFF